MHEVVDNKRFVRQSGRLKWAIRATECLPSLSARRALLSTSNDAVWRGRREPTASTAANLANGASQLMAKYDPLGAFLRRWAARNNACELELSLTHIEGIIRAILPKRALEAGWWSNQAASNRNNAQSRAWLDAGFEARLAADREHVCFRRHDRRPGRHSEV